MKFVMTYRINAENWDKAVDRFLEGGGLPPEGVTMLGRWHAPGRHGYILLASEDQTAIYRWTAEWNDVCGFDITPVVEDEEAAGVLQSLR